MCVASQFDMLDRLLDLADKLLLGVDSVLIVLFLLQFAALFFCFGQSLTAGFELFLSFSVFCFAQFFQPELCRILDF